MTSDEALRDAIARVTGGLEGFSPDQIAEAFWNAALEWAKQGQEPFAWCIETQDSADWCFSKSKEGVQLNALLMDVGCNLTEPFEIYTHPAPAQPVRLTRYETAMIELKCADSNGNIDAEFYANEIQDAMLAKGAAQPAINQCDTNTVVAKELEDGSRQASEPAQPAVVQQLVEALQDFSDYVHVEQSSTDGAVQYNNTQINRLAFKARAALKAAKGE